MRQTFIVDIGCYWYLNIYIYNLRAPIYGPSMKHPDKIRKECEIFC